MFTLRWRRRQLVEDVVLVMELYLAWAYRGAFRPMQRAKGRLAWRLVAL